MLPRQRAYRSVQTTEFKAWTWILLFNVVPFYVAFLATHSIPPLSFRSFVRSPIRPRWKYFRCFCRSVILRISLWSTHTDDSFICFCLNFPLDSGREKWGRDKDGEMLCYPSAWNRRENENQPRKKNDPADALTWLLLFPNNWSFSLLRPFKELRLKRRFLSFFLGAMRMLFYDYFMV